MSNSNFIRTPTPAKRLSLFPAALHPGISGLELLRTSSVKHEIQPTDYMPSIHSGTALFLLASILVLVAGPIVLDKPEFDNDFVGDSSSDGAPPSGPRIPSLLPFILIILALCIPVIKSFPHEIVEMLLKLIRHTKWRLHVSRKRRTAPHIATLSHGFAATATSSIAFDSAPVRPNPMSSLRLYPSLSTMFCSVLHMHGLRLLDELIFDLDSAENQTVNTIEKGVGSEPLSKFRICYSKGIQTTPCLPVVGGTDMDDEPYEKRRQMKLHKHLVKIVVGPTLLRFAITSTPRISSLHSNRP